MYIPSNMMSVLLPLYNSPQRHYHNWNHIQFCISKFAEYLLNSVHTDIDHMSLYLAICFHDAIYSPYPHNGWTNEMQSSELMYSFCYENRENYKDFGYSYETLANILNIAKECIEATQFHLDDINDKAYKYLDHVKVILDIDLSGFAKPFNEVYKDSDKIFKEYEPLGLSHKVMLENRINFLKTLLDKEQIFYTDYFYNTYEEIARSNIQGAIELSEQELSILE